MDVFWTLKVKSFCPNNHGIGKDVPRSQRGPPMGNPYISLILRGYLWVFSSPRIPREHNKYHGYTVRGTPNCPLIHPRHPGPPSEDRYLNLQTSPEVRLLGVPNTSLPGIWGFWMSRDSNYRWCFSTNPFEIKYYCSQIGS